LPVDATKTTQVFVSEQIRFSLKVLAASDEARLPTKRKEEQRLWISHSIHKLSGFPGDKERLFGGDEWISWRVRITEAPIEVG